MKNKEIVKKAVEKAEQNGNGYEFPYNHETTIDLVTDDFNYQGNSLMWQVIFSHSFAKALFGEEEVQVEVVQDYHEDIPIWQLKLQEMVLCEEPLKYMEEFMEGVK